MKFRQMREGTWLLLGTVFPILLFFALPLIGFTEGLALTVAKVAVFVFHVVIMIEYRRSTTKKPENEMPAQENRTLTHRLSPLRLGFAFGTGLGLAYISCVALMAVLPRELAIRFFNNLFHCLDVEPLLHWDMTSPEMLFGAVSTFIIGWLFAGVVAGLYNLAACPHLASGRQ